MVELESMSKYEPLWEYFQMGGNYDMMLGMNVTMEKFGYPQTLIKEFQHWTIQLRLKQVTLGSLVLINKSDATNLGQLTADEWAEFAEVSSFAEKLLRRGGATS
jgi:diadenosine tetraphosphate (Ap4A) HIT family hydrolase